MAPICGDVLSSVLLRQMRIRHLPNLKYLIRACFELGYDGMQGKAHGHAEVLKCLVKNYKTLNDTCQTEMSRAVRMALWEYQRGMALTGKGHSCIPSDPSAVKGQGQRLFITGSKTRRMPSPPPDATQAGGSRCSDGSCPRNSHRA